MSDRGALAGLPLPVVDKMDAVDFMRASEAVSGFWTLARQVGTYSRRGGGRIRVQPR